MKHRLLALSLLVAAGLLLPSPARAAACSGTSGVTVVVDYDDGRTRVGCAPGDPASGYQALQQAGFTLTLATGNGQGALCSIDSVPNHPCTSMPPANAYWAYFHAARGGSWSYSDVGGGAHDPEPGTVEGWRFRGSRSKVPRVSPPAAPSTPKPKPTPTSKPRPSSKPQPSSKPSAVPAVTPSASSSTASASSSASTASSTPTAAASSAAAPADAGETVTSSSAPLTRPDESGGASWVWGAVIVAVLGAVAGGLILRRRQG